MENDYAVVVGVNKYRDLTDLEGAVNDALTFVNWLIIKGEVPPANIALFTSSNRQELVAHFPAELAFLRDDALTIETISSKGILVEHLNDFLDEHSPDRDTKIGRRLYLFFAGHGISSNSGEAVLLMPRVRLSDRSKFVKSISGTAVARDLADSALFDEVLLFMDCCRDTVPLTGFFMSGLDVEPVLSGSAHKVFGYATSEGTKSREKDFGEGSKRGIFSYSLLEGLDGLAATHSGVVTSTGLSKYIVRRVREHNPSRREQLPKFEPCDEIEICQTDAKPLVHVRIDRLAAEQQIIVKNSSAQPLDPPAEIVEEDDTKWVVALEPGKLYTFWVDAGDGEQQFVKADQIDRERNHVKRI